MTKEISFTEEREEEIKNSPYDIEIFIAGIKAGIEFDDIEEAYNGKWCSDKKFVQDLVEDCDLLPGNFPSYIHIDWEGTAREIMMDYTEQDGYYFRNL